MSRDTSTFGSLQALPSWLNHFGDTTVNGKPALSTYAKSIANSVMFIGRLLGCTTFEPVVERTGFKWLIIMIAVLQVVAVVGEYHYKGELTSSPTHCQVCSRPRGY
jgi:hypothetical protein